MNSDGQVEITFAIDLEELSTIDLYTLITSVLNSTEV